METTRACSHQSQQEPPPRPHRGLFRGRELRPPPQPCPLPPPPPQACEVDLDGWMGRPPAHLCPLPLGCDEAICLPAWNCGPSLLACTIPTSQHPPLPPTFRTSAQGSSGSGREEADEPGGLQRPGGSDPGIWVGAWTVAGERRLPEFLSTSPIPAGQLVGEALPSKSIVTDPGSSYVVVFHKIILGDQQVLCKIGRLSFAQLLGWGW